jgi:hypothetical protein
MAETKIPFWVTWGESEKQQQSNKLTELFMNVVSQWINSRQTT